LSCQLSQVFSSWAGFLPSRASLLAVEGPAGKLQTLAEPVWPCGHQLMLSVTACWLLCLWYCRMGELAAMKLAELLRGLRSTKDHPTKARRHLPQ